MKMGSKKASIYVQKKKKKKSNLCNLLHMEYMFACWFYVGCNVLSYVSVACAIWGFVASLFFFFNGIPETEMPCAITASKMSSLCRG